MVDLSLKSFAPRKREVLACEQGQFKVVFGMRLDVPQDQLDGWKECLGNTAECWNKVMKHWLDSGGIAEYCVSWGWEGF